ncbi:MAG: response regulator transcription factor [Acidimicrobiales bacterium]|nr:response regulator transcription factor [Acidimicrobiales bacterium]
MPDIVIVADSVGLFDEVGSVLEEPGTSVRWVHRGEDVREEINTRPADLVITDMQVGTMGGVAIALDLRLEADAGRLEPCPVLILLDRRPDVFLARRSGAQGWVVKPLDPIRLRTAVAALLSGGTWHDASFAPQPLAVPVN